MVKDKIRLSRYRKKWIIYFGGQMSDGTYLLSTFWNPYQRVFIKYSG